MARFSPAEWALNHLRDLQARGFAVEDVEKAAESMAHSVMANRNTRWNVRACKACEKFSGCSVKALGYGALNSPLMFVTERATADDILWGQSLTGLEGFLLALMLDKLDIDLSMVYVTSLVKCHKDGVAAEREEAENCVIHLAQEIEAIKPAVVVTFGQLVPSVLFGDPNFRLAAPPRSRADWARYTEENWKEYAGAFLIRPTYPLRAILDTEGERQVLAKQTIWLDLRAAVGKAEELRPGFSYRINRQYALAPTR